MFVFIEPEAMDYWLQFKEECELVAEKMKKRILKFNIRTKESLFFLLAVAEVFRFSKKEYN